MAPPPKHVVTRKLVNKFFNNYLPKEPIYAREEKEKLFDCYRQYGIASQACKEYEILYDYIETKSIKYREKLEQMKFRETVMEHLRKPRYKHDLKGRYKTLMNNFARDERDGVN